MRLGTEARPTSQWNLTGEPSNFECKTLPDWLPNKKKLWVRRALYFMYFPSFICCFTSCKNNISDYTDYMRKAKCLIIWRKTHLSFWIISILLHPQMTKKVLLESRKSFCVAGHLYPHPIKTLLLDLSFLWVITMRKKFENILWILPTILMINQF